MKSIYFYTALVLCLITTKSFSQGVYMVVDGIPGSSTTKGYENSIELTSAQFTESMAVPRTTGSGAGVGKAAVSNLTITKLVEGFGSAELMKVLVTGKHIATTTIEYTTVLKSVNTTTYKIELKDVLVVKHSISLVPNCPNGCSGLAESFELDYGSIRVTTYKQDQTGKFLVGGIYMFNKLTNSPSF